MDGAPKLLAKLQIIAFRPLLLSEMFSQSHCHFVFHVIPRTIEHEMIVPD
jgi:hypothetical protein